MNFPSPGLARLAVLVVLASTPVAADPVPPPGQPFRPCPICPEMLLIPPGSVTAGNPKDYEDPEPGAPKRPVIAVDKTFALGRFEVTQAEWEMVMGSNPSAVKGATLPVDHVDWKIIQDFIAKLNAKTGKSFRLPTEKEWEYAARAGSAASYYFGEDARQLGDYAWYVENSGGITHPVGQKKPNAFGLYDMLGNVWEWTGDCYLADFFAKAKPDHGIDWEKGCYRVTRGGSALNLPMATTTFYRASLKQPLHNANLGFRLAMSLP
ncbi:hypothetical protein A6A04_17205 [Paramagnetospirillum marisnigri]|uniref:Sulfatase-modifying factor enzyme-like domain-containing protein n=1 Tax=Paramagnetospirillum marisnigri TaxID=1285242 RepID=A0A178MSG2_9PROT|nr:formylglycine-generating enzyme family protein [Paramagnetospirillum marisnigri]OAN50864.1 hypothetical protein A6A04_17205 [Paramagnetospirillum marisnigri]